MNILVTSRSHANAITSTAHGRPCEQKAMQGDACIN